MTGTKTTTAVVTAIGSLLVLLLTTEDIDPNQALLLSGLVIAVGMVMVIIVNDSRRLDSTAERVEKASIDYQSELNKLYRRIDELERKLEEVTVALRKATTERDVLYAIIEKLSIVKEGSSDE